MADEGKSGIGSESSDHDVCRDFLRGICDRGNRCKFKHPENENGEYEDIKSQNVCRDFLRGLCSRGLRCKYRHPNPTMDKAGGGTKLEFCHDYQNPGGCKRNNCRFVHATKQEELVYNESGTLPARLQGILSGMEAGPVCKDFMFGKCNRERCKYRHITQSEFEFEQSMAATNATMMAGGGAGDMSGAANFMGGGGGMMGSGPGLGALSFDVPAPRKRMRPDGTIDSSGLSGMLAGSMGGGTGMNYDPTGGALGAAFGGESQRESMLEEENYRLMGKVKDLEKQVQYLTAANEVLLEQNARIRVGGGVQSSVGVGQVGAVTAAANSAATSIAQSVASIQSAVQPLMHSAQGPGAAAVAAAASLSSLSASSMAAAGAPMRSGASNMIMTGTDSSGMISYPSIVSRSRP